MVKEPSQMSKTSVMVEGALMVALGFVLSLIPIPHFPWGGSVTVCATLPVIMVSLRHGAKWGAAAAGVFSLLQMLLGMGSVVAVPVKTMFFMVLCALLDYVLAYTFLGFAGPVAALFRNRTAGIAAGVAATGALRLLCSFFSGVLVWGQYAWEGWPVWLYSLVYNAGWCLPDVAIVLAAALLLSRVKQLGMLGGAADKYGQTPGKAASS